jgi:hypothetical protein
LVKIRLSSFTGGGRPQAQMGTWGEPPMFCNLAG